MPCVCHQLGNVMKHVIEDLKKVGEMIENGFVQSARSKHTLKASQESEIIDDLKTMKEIVNYVKSAGLNDHLPDGFKLVQEVDTRFGTTFDVVERFVKSAAVLSEIGSEKLQSSPNNLKKLSRTDGSAEYPALDAIIIVFGPVRRLLTTLETSLTPTTTFVIPQFEVLKKKIADMAKDGTKTKG